MPLHHSTRKDDEDVRRRLETPRGSPKHARSAWQSSYSYNLMGYVVNVHIMQNDDEKIQSAKSCYEQLTYANAIYQDLSLNSWVWDNRTKVSQNIRRITPSTNQYVPRPSKSQPNSTCGDSESGGGADRFDLTWTSWNANSKASCHQSCPAGNDNIRRSNWIPAVPTNLISIPFKIS